MGTHQHFSLFCGRPYVGASQKIPLSSLNPLPPPPSLGAGHDSSGASFHKHSALWLSSGDSTLHFSPRDAGSTATTTTRHQDLDFGTAAPLDSSRLGTLENLATLSRATFVVVKVLLFLQTNTPIDSTQKKRYKLFFPHEILGMSCHMYLETSKLVKVTRDSQTHLKEQLPHNSRNTNTYKSYDRRDSNSNKTERKSN